jgi:flavin reductase (DIM6/NTAB) family NADH-FMN oxidoreductase RutF
VGVDADQFRQALARWASGVTIATSLDADSQPQGMTLSAFCSVSLDPPLVLVCADQSSNTHRAIQTSKVLGVSLLASEQRELSERFASKELEAVRFEGLDCSAGSSGCPRIPGALAWLDCRVVQSVAAGDHVIYVAEVERAELGSGAPLLYFRGSYAALR